MSKLLTFTILSLLVLLGSLIAMVIVAHSQRMMVTRPFARKKKKQNLESEDEGILKKTMNAFKEKLTKPFIIKPFYVLLIGFAISAGIFLIPVVESTTALVAADDTWFTRALVTIHNTIKLFVVDSDFQFVTDATAEITSIVEKNFITAVGACYYVIAPVFTAVSLLSFVKDLFSIWKIKSQNKRAVYIFSELNDMSISIAKDIVKNEDGLKMLIFTDVYKDDDEENRELILNAQRLGAICLSRDLVELKTQWFKRNKLVKYYCIGRDQDENMKHALKMINRYQYLFSKRKARAVKKIDEQIKSILNDPKVKELEEKKNSLEKQIKKIKNDNKHKRDSEIIALIQPLKDERNIYSKELRPFHVQLDMLETYKEALILGTRRNKSYKEDYARIIEEDAKREERLRLLPVYEQNKKDRMGKLVYSLKTAKRALKNKPEIFVYAANAESEALLDNAQKDYVHVRRINENRDLVFETMSKNSIFDDVKAQYEANGKGDAKEKEINVAIVGLGGYGMELLKTLTWLGQAKGYYLNAYVFDAENGTEKLKMTAPELLEHNYLSGNDSELDANGEDKEARGKIYPKFVCGETRYSIHFYNGVDVNDSDFFEKINKINAKHPLTSVYITLGNDSLNVQTAMNIRRQTARKTLNPAFPRLYAVVFNTIKTEILTSANESNTYNYDINFIGNLEEAFSRKTIEQAEIEKIGYTYHSFWADASDPYNVRSSLNDYDRVEYFRRSSMAQAFFYQLIKKHGIVFENFVELAIAEHNRWNAFMRADGSVDCETDKHKDTFVKKTHHDLKNFFELRVSDQVKDCAFTMGGDIVTIKDKSFEKMSEDDQIKAIEEYKNKI